MIKISTVIICKNESSCIRTCIESVKYSDEIIILDTGSKDNTMEIAREYTDKAYQDTSFYTGSEGKDGIFDFSGARNKAKEYATNEWILSIDCDEILQEGGINMLKEIISKNNNDIDGISVLLTSGSSSLYNTRVFKKNLNWSGKIHEVIVPSKCIRSEVNIEYGRSAAHDLDPMLDLRIMEDIYMKDPNNTRNLFYLARENFYYGSQDIKYYNRAEKLFLKYMDIAISHQEKVEAMYILATIYWHNGEWEGDKARYWCGKAIAGNPNFKGALMLMSAMTGGIDRIRWKSFADLADNTGCLFIH